MRVSPPLLRAFAIVQSTSKPSLGALASKAGKTSSLSTKSTPKEKNTYVSREDKAARQRKAMFKDDDDDTSGSMALARAQKANGGGFSGSERGSASPRPSGSPRPSSNGGPSRSSSGSSSKPKSSLGRSSSTAKPANNGKASAANSAKDRLKAGFDPTSFIRLNTDKRDTRTIEEIEADMRRKRAGGASPKPDTKPSSSKEKTRASELNRPSGSGSSGRPSGSNSASTAPKRKPGEDESRARDSSKRPKMDQRPSSASNPKHRRRDSTSSEDSEGYDSDESSDRGRRGGRGGGRGGYGLEPSTRDEIWQLMGRNRNRDVMRDEESDDDMEASGADVLREEQRASVFSLFSPSPLLPFSPSLLSPSFFSRRLHPSPSTERVPSLHTVLDWRRGKTSRSKRGSRPPPRRSASPSSQSNLAELHTRLYHHRSKQLPQHNHPAS